MLYRKFLHLGIRLEFWGRYEENETIRIIRSSVIYLENNLYNNWKLCYNNRSKNPEPTISKTQPWFKSQYGCLGSKSSNNISN
jgi:hypothetical protein